MKKTQNTKLKGRLHPGPALTPSQASAHRKCAGGRLGPRAADRAAGALGSGGAGSGLAGGPGLPPGRRAARCSGPAEDRRTDVSGKRCPVRRATSRSPPWTLLLYDRWLATSGLRQSWMEDAELRRLLRTSAKHIPLELPTDPENLSLAGCLSLQTGPLVGLKHRPRDSSFRDLGQSQRTPSGEWRGGRGTAPLHLRGRRFLSDDMLF